MAARLDRRMDDTRGRSCRRTRGPRHARLHFSRRINPEPFLGRGFGHAKNERDHMEPVAAVSAGLDGRSTHVFGFSKAAGWLEIWNGPAGRIENWRRNSLRTGIALHVGGFSSD